MFQIETFFLHHFFVCPHIMLPSWALEADTKIGTAAMWHVGSRGTIRHISPFLSAPPAATVWRAKASICARNLL